jgi:hypothetical protein
VQDANPPPSSWHLKLTPASASEKSNEALELFDGSGGALVIVGPGGGVPSTVKIGCEPWRLKAIRSR